MKSVTKKVIGKVEVLERHRTLKGFIFRQGQEVEYYSMSRIKQDCGCGKPITYNEFYETQYGLLPTIKGKIIWYIY